MLTVRQQLYYWGVAFLVLLLLLWMLGNVILPFLIGSAIAYFLDPLADRLERLGLSRRAATALISLVAILIFVVLSLLIVPMLVRQLAQLVDAAPTILGQLQQFLNNHFPQLMESQGAVRDTLIAIGKTIQARGGELAQTLLTSAMSVVNALVFMVVVPVVAFYMLLDWDRMVAMIDNLLPLDHRETIRKIAFDIDGVLAGFVRGQVSVCVVLGTYYAVALSFAGLSYGLVVGAIAGFITFIPYVGAIVGGTLAIGLALFQFWGHWLHIALIAGIFALGQFLEGNFITPRLVGGAIGLHPVWLLFALSAFGAVFGFVGMLVAVPVAASIGVLIRFGTAQYLQSPLYKGESGANGD